MSRNSLQLCQRLGTWLSLSLTAEHKLLLHCTAHDAPVALCDNQHSINTRLSFWRLLWYAPQLRVLYTAPVVSILCLYCSVLSCIAAALGRYISACTSVTCSLLGCRVVVVRLMSAAGTGFYYALRKPRNREKMVLRKYDPVGMLFGFCSPQSTSVLGLY